MKSAKSAAAETAEAATVKPAAVEPSPAEIVKPVRPELAPVSITPITLHVVETATIPSAALRAVCVSHML